jgi:hypothetical protein
MFGVGRRSWAALLLVVAIGAAAAYYFFLGGNGTVTAWQLRLHAESSLTYPHSYRTSSYQKDEDDANGWFRIENTDPSPALAETQFYTADSVDKVVAWYEQGLSARGWVDVVVQGDGSRGWDRGTHEQFNLGCGHQSDSADLWCDAQYSILSARFTLSYPPAPSLGDPVSLAAVEQRQVGLAAVGATAADPRDGTAEASAARLTWPVMGGAGLRCCGIPVIVTNVSAAQQLSPSLSAYHAIALKAVEYDVPSQYDIHRNFGRISSEMKFDLEYSGFVQVRSESTLLFGQSADAFEFKRDDREVVFYAMSFGPALNRPNSGYSYRVITLSVIYDVAPTACSPAKDDCLSVLFRGDASTGWSF